MSSRFSIHFKYFYLALIGGTIFLLSTGSVTSFAHETLNDKTTKETRETLAGKNSSNKAIASNLQVTPATINLIKEFEGFRSTTYIDSNGMPVIGYGQSKINGKSVAMGQYITQSQADTALEQEIYQIQQEILAAVKVQLNPNQLGALASLVYNTGTGIITRSTLFRKLNAGDYAGASREFLRWNKAHQNGVLVPFPGLSKRRQFEQQLFLTPYK